MTKQFPYLKRNFTKLFGLGFSRTGTTSLSHALEILGIRQIHMPMDAQTYWQFVAGDPNLKVVWRYDALLDITTIPIWKQLDKLWPGSKFILTTRSMETWIPSLKAHWDRGGKPICEDAKDIWPLSRLLLTLTFGQLDWDENKFIAAYKAHHEAVLKHFQDRDDLLVMNICDCGDGWDKLCTFLNLPVPEETFPHLLKRDPKGPGNAGFCPVGYEYPKPQERHLQITIGKADHEAAT